MSVVAGRIQAELQKTGRFHLFLFIVKICVHYYYSVECGSYTGIKLLEHAIKVVERIFEHRIWQQIDIDDMQFGFWPTVLSVAPLVHCVVCHLVYCFPRLEKGIGTRAPIV